MSIIPLLLLTLRVALLLLLGPAHVHAATPFATRLTAGVSDIEVDFGLVVSRANTLVPAAKLSPPPGNYTAGTMVLGMLRSLEAPGAHEVYLTNSTGNIPLLGQDPGMCLYRWLTSDFQHYTGGVCVLFLPTDGLGDIKTITRDDDSGKYYLLYWGPARPSANGGTPYLYTSVDHGTSWHGPQLTAGLDHYNPPGTTIHAKDDLNLIFQPGVGLVDMQLFWEQNSTIPGGPGVYCDNGGCDKRRVLGTMFSADGVNWNFTGSTRMPGADINDPPELQFYRMRPFYIGNTTRLAAHTLLYAPSPSQSILGPAYGRQPNMCVGRNGSECHGPHLYEEW